MTIKAVHRFAVAIAAPAAASALALSAPATTQAAGHGAAPPATFSAPTRPSPGHHDKCWLIPPHGNCDSGHGGWGGAHGAWGGGQGGQGGHR
jgi:hypothetical protein